MLNVIVFLIFIHDIQQTTCASLTPTQLIEQRSKKFQDNLERPSTGDDRAYDQKLPALVNFEYLPNKTFSTNTKLAIPEFLLKTTWRLIGNLTNPRQFARAKKKQLVQERIPDSTPFPCSTKGMRSAQRPDSYEKLRPGDIDVVAAMGDSLTAGSGLLATSIYQIAVTNRGLSWLGGGQGTWREFVTLPNLIKVFNPNLKGYATGDTLYSQQYQNQKLLVAEPAAIIGDLPMMAQTLIYKMKKDPTINFQEDWKLINIMIGGYDLCSDLCFWKRPQNGPAHFAGILARTFDYLMANMPRTVVNFINTPDILNFINGHRNLTAECKLKLDRMCYCINGDPVKPHQGTYKQIVRKVLSALSEVANDKKYQSKKDFHIIEQTMLSNLSLPLIPFNVKKPDGAKRSDLRMVVADCFHLSQRAHAQISASLWNSLLTPGGYPDADWNIKLPEELKCPTESNPYFYF